MSRFRSSGTIWALEFPWELEGIEVNADLAMKSTNLKKQVEMPCYPQVKPLLAEIAT